jgi:NAD kinase
MQRLTERKMNLVIRETRLDELISRYNTLDQARFYVEHLGADFSDYVAEDRKYKSAIGRVEALLRKLGRVQVLQRRFIPNFIFGRDDLIIVVGQDGLLANTLKYLDEQPVIGINPDPERWGGELLPFGVEELEDVVLDVLAHKRDTAKISIAKAVLDDGRSLYAVNDLFIGAKTHVSARYELSINGKTESQSSSGVIVSTGLGSTGWLKSILAGAAGITGALLDRKFEMALGEKVPWDAPYLNFSVREPFPSKTTFASVVYGKITPSCPLTLLSQMSGNGVIFSDGVENDFLEFNSGMTAKVSLAKKCGHVVV